MAPNTNHTAPNDDVAGMKKELSFGTLMHVYDHDDEGTSKISKQTVCNVMNAVKTTFPNSLTGHILAFQLKDILAHRGFTENNTILGTCLGLDDCNRDLEDELRDKFGNNYSLSGLAGFCFGGVSAVADMLHHTPVGGHCLLVYGPHVGCDMDGTWGKVNRRGHEGSGVCCASATAAAIYAEAVRTGERSMADAPVTLEDAQQTWVERLVLPYADRLHEAEQPAVELPHVLFECQTKLMDEIVQKAITALKPGSKLALVGGITVNTPEGTAEYFVPKRFELLDHEGSVLENELQELHSSRANTATW